MKKIICLMLAVIMAFLHERFCVCGEIDANDEVSLIDNSIEEIDALLIASSMLNAPDIANDILVSGATENDVLPLYNAFGEIVAYYVSFEPTGYAVVNNNIENPSVIEFGEGVNQLIDDILKVESNPHIIYNNPTEVYSANVKARTVNASSDLYDYYPVLEEANYAAVAQLAQLRQFVQSDASVCSDGDYGFIDWEICPPVHMIGIWLQMQHPQIGQPQVNLVRLQKTTVVPLRLQILHCTLQIAVIQI